jgi:hypothetical protein
MKRTDKKLKMTALSKVDLEKAGGAAFRIRGWTNCEDCGAGWNHFEQTHPANGCRNAGIGV